MSISTARMLRTVTFGDLDAEVWGMVWASDDGSASVALGIASESITVSADLGGSDAEEGWTLIGQGLELSVTPDGDPSRSAGEEDGSGGFDQLCRVTGEITVGEAHRALDCPGRRALRTERLDRERFESAREVSAWFGSGEGLAVLSLRPRGAPAHGDDLVSAALFAGGAPVPVSEARLSTTYSAGGLPVRVNVELWLAGEEGEEYPRRAAGEGIGAPAQSRADGFELLATPFRWHSSGRDGAGVYVLLRSR
jgi:hypothetical protein